jgi:hypothetical protein
MTTLVWVSLALALASLGFSIVALALSLRRQTAPPLASDPTRLAFPEPTPSHLEGLSVVLSIKQDHTHPVFANMLTETLRKLDAEVSTISPDEFDDFLERWGSHADCGDLLISGNVTCNGYAEVYYRAEITCATRSETICTMVENPAAGDRQANLAKELVARIETEITKRLSRNERRLALRELRGLG